MLVREELILRVIRENGITLETPFQVSWLAVATVRQKVETK